MTEKQDPKLIRHLPTIGRVFTPTAMLVALTYEISTSMAVAGGWYYAILVGAAATAVGVECVGILAGHTFQAFWLKGDRQRAALALALLIIYTAAGVYILRHEGALVAIPVVAAVVYLVGALADQLTASQLEDETARQLAGDLERQRQAQLLAEDERDRQLARELKRQRQADNTALKLAKLDAQKPGRSQADGAQIPGDWRALTRAHKQQIAQLTTGEIVDLVGVDQSTARRWLAKVRANGHYKNEQ